MEAQVPAMDEYCRMDDIHFLPAEGLAEAQSTGQEEGPSERTAWEERPT